MFTMTLLFLFRLFFWKIGFYSLFFVWISFTCKWIWCVDPICIINTLLGAKIFFSFFIFSFSKGWQSWSFLNHWFLLYNLNNIFTSILQWKFLHSFIKIWRIITIRIKSRWLSYWSGMWSLMSFIFLYLI